MADEQQMKDLIGKGCTCQFFDAGRVDGKLTFNRIACERTCPVHDITDYQRGLEDAAKVCEERAREIGEGNIGFTDVCVVIHRIRALADK